MPGRRWSDGLHQAVEAKETTAYRQDRAREPDARHRHLPELLPQVQEALRHDRHGRHRGRGVRQHLQARRRSCIPPNRPLRRIENPDLVYRTEEEKWEAIVTEIIDEHKKGRPVLVGTVSIDKSEKLSTMLDRRGLKRGTTTGGGADKHVVLNAKYHAQEAEFVAQAGRKGSVTIATNMAGRGTDILLGGNAEFMARQQALAEQVAERLPKGEERFVEDEQFVYFYHLDAFYRVPKARLRADLRALQEVSADAEHEEVVGLGGLHILGTERHEARRIDNQLRGRAGRQGDPGLVALLSLARRRSDAHLRLGSHLRPDAEARHGRRRADRARHGVEGHRACAETGRGAELLRQKAPARVRRRDEQAAGEHLLAAPRDSRSQDPLRRRRGRRGDRRHARIPDVAGGGHRSTRSSRPTPRGRPTSSSGTSTRSSAKSTASSPSTPRSMDSPIGRRTRFATSCGTRSSASYEEKEKLVGRDVLQRVERDIMLQIVDTQWKDHLYSLDHLKEGIGLRGYGQRDPLVEYKSESFDLFQAMKDRVDEEIVRYLWWLRPVMGDGADAAPSVPVPRRPCGRERRAGAPVADFQQPIRAAPGRAFAGHAEAAPPAAGVRIASASTRRRRRCGGEDGAARRAEGREERSVSLRQRKEIQEVPWSSRPRCPMTCKIETTDAHGRSSPA